MARSLSAITLTATLKATLLNALTNVSNSPSFAAGINVNGIRLINGTGPYQVNRVWQSLGRTLGSGTNEDLNIFSFAGLDIGAGAGLDMLGQSMALTEIVALLIHNQPGSAGNLNIGGQGTANAWTSWISTNAATIGPYEPDGGVFFFEPGQPAFAVGNANNNLLRIAAAGGAVTYDIILLGRQ